MTIERVAEDEKSSEMKYISIELRRFTSLKVRQSYWGLSEASLMM